MAARRGKVRWTMQMGGTIVGVGFRTCFITVANCGVWVGAGFLPHVRTAPW